MKLTKEQIQKCFADGLGYRDMERKYDVHHTTIRRYAVKYGIDNERPISKFEHIDKGIKDACKENGLDVADVRHGWLKSKSASLFFKNPFADEQTKQDFEVKVLDIISKHKINIAKPKNEVGEYLLVIDPADVHIGSLCSETETGAIYNNEVAVSRVLQGIEAVIGHAKPYKANEVLLVIGNDILHVDNAFRTTTSGTKQDTEGMWYDNFLIGLELYKTIITRLAVDFSKVHVVYNPSNHDYTNGYFLAVAVKEYFSKVKHIYFNVNMSHRKYHVYGRNLIGTTHGDGAKRNDLALLMAHEASANWNYCIHRYFYTHHVHHKDSKDVFSVSIESVRSVKTADSWHHRNGYQHAPCALEGYLHHKEYGQRARFTHVF